MEAHADGDYFYAVATGFGTTVVAVVLAAVIAVGIGATAPTTCAMNPALRTPIMQNPDGSYQLAHIDAESTKVYEDTPAENHPYLLYSSGRTQFISSWRDWWMLAPTTACNGQIEVHIPVGSIKTEFKLGG